ncbi:hypothetical protein NBRC110019_21330 [Neptunitalea chrysea]|uniref:CYTH domain-containing protein n=1 Tax=Neptunitalea chrysea TaxID=1647581 RepID=A0A9W6EWK1_9FLAO|nr:CYTH domain-containing protein [Neptunitalea chrysea]GLB53093.1 hypothetical protein NBRC110019_21330 [Neptunitalea chrysea]
MIEIERKFLVTAETFKQEAIKQIRIVQGFLSTDPERTVRIRIKGATGFITVKGKSDDEGLSRFEWEKEITVEEADTLLQKCLPGVIDKIRYEVPMGKFVFEVDEFFGDNEGLVVAEVELESKDEEYPKPAWLGAEVTGDIKYYNSQLSSNPYNNW